MIRPTSAHRSLRNQPYSCGVLVGKVFHGASSMTKMIASTFEPCSNPSGFPFEVLESSPHQKSSRISHRFRGSSNRVGSSPRKPSTVRPIIDLNRLLSKTSREVNKNTNNNTDKSGALTPSG